MLLAIDIGNTNIKCKAWNERDTLFVKSFPVTDIESMTEYLNGYSPDNVIVASVGSIAIESSIIKLFSGVNTVHFTSQSFSLGVSNGYEEPSQLGVDRWLAIIEAFNDSGGNACCVFDLGTALTLDVVDEFGRHEGGYIVPGLSLMREALLKSTQKIRYEPTKDLIGMEYATNTADAVERGTLSVIISWISSEIDRFKNTHREGVVYVTGGGAKYVVPFLDVVVNYNEDLVLDGLKRIASN